MAKQLFNNSPNVMVIRYRVNGMMNRFDLSPYTYAEIPNLNDYSQLLNIRDREVLEAMERGDVVISTPSGRSKARRVGAKTLDFVPGGSPISTTVNLILTNLSASAQTLYNAAAVGNFIRVSKADYEAVEAATSASRYGLPNSIMDTSTSSAWVLGTTFTFTDSFYSAATIPANRYIIGFRTEVRDLDVAASYDFEIATSTTYKGTYAEICSNVTGTSIAAVNKQAYFIRKNPTDITTAKTYMAFKSARQIASVGYTNFVMGYNLSGLYSSWDNWDGTPAKMQFLATPNRSW